MRISDWSSDVCSSDLVHDDDHRHFGGKTEKRLGLFGVFDVHEEAKQLNDAGQKVYSSIEVEPNFAGKGKAYLMGDRKSVVLGKSVSVRVDLGGRRIIKKKRINT